MLSFDKTQGSDFVIKLTLNAKGVWSSAFCYRFINCGTERSECQHRIVHANLISKFDDTFLLLVKKTSNSCSVVGRLGNKTLPFSQHRENCGLLLFDFANCFLIHIFTLQNPQIVSISPQSHRAEADVSLFPKNCNASLPREGCARGAACCTVCRSRRRRLLRSCGVLDGSVDSVCCLAHCYLYRRLRHSHVDFDVS
jgi:hypothetical protein